MFDLTSVLSARCSALHRAFLHANIRLDPSVHLQFIISIGNTGDITRLIELVVLLSLLLLLFLWCCPAYAGSLFLLHTDTHTRTHTPTLTHSRVCVCVCVCRSYVALRSAGVVLSRSAFKRVANAFGQTGDLDATKKIVDLVRVCV